MAHYRNGNHNPFDDDATDDDFKPGNRNRNPFGDEEGDDNNFKPGNRNRNRFGDEEDDDKFEDVGKSPDFLRLKQEKELLEQRMIDSSYRSVNMISESQNIASETADNLNIQREKLERTNRTLDKMQDDLNESDRNITGLKGMWGTMSNWFKKPMQRSSSPASNSPKKDAKEIRNGIKETDNDIQGNLQRMDQVGGGGGGKYSNMGGAESSRGGVSTNDIVDTNLDQMLAGLTMLKSQGLALGSEIDSQNELLDQIHNKVEKTDVRIGSQESRMRKILK